MREKDYQILVIERERERERERDDVGIDSGHQND
jgi:hypothetical protein